MTTYNKKLAENARHEHRRKQREIKYLCREEIHNKVIMEWCKCGVCKTRNYKQILRYKNLPKHEKCMGLYFIKNTCNTLGIDTPEARLTGKSKLWNETQVERVLFGDVSIPKQHNPLEEFFDE